MYAILMVTFTIKIPPMLASIYHTWILWVMKHNLDNLTPCVDPYHQAPAASSQRVNDAANNL